MASRQDPLARPPPHKTPTMPSCHIRSCSRVAFRKNPNSFLLLKLRTHSNRRRSLLTDEGKDPGPECFQGLEHRHADLAPIQGLPKIPVFVPKVLIDGASSHIKDLHQLRSMEQKASLHQVLEEGVHTGA